MTILKNHPVWQNLLEVVKRIDTTSLVMEHLALCNYTISGYWDEGDRFYEEIILPHNLSPKLLSSGIIVKGDKRQIQLKFALNMITAGNSISVAELMLIYDENLEFLDEIWQINLTSEFLKVS